MLLILCVKIGVTFFLPDNVVLSPLEGDERALGVENEAPGVRGDADFEVDLVNGLARFALSGVTGLGEEPFGVEPFRKAVPLRDDPDGDLDDSGIDLDNMGPERDALRVSTRGDADLINLEAGAALESRDVRLFGGVEREDNVLVAGVPKL